MEPTTSSEQPTRASKQAKLSQKDQLLDDHQDGGQPQDDLLDAERNEAGADEDATTIKRERDKRKAESKKANRTAKAVQKQTDDRNLLWEIFQSCVDGGIREKNPPVLVTLDIEADLDRHSMTEIGIGTFDPVEAAVLMAGEKEMRAEWFLASLEAVHYRIQENASLMITQELDRRGKKLWAGTHFEFGQSFWISKKEAAKVISDHVDAASSRNSVNGRDIVVVAHASKNDDKWLKRNGMDLSRMPRLKDTIDTQKLCANFMSYHRSALSDVLKNLGIDMRYRHNGGNDAMYTQAAMILTMLQEGIQDGVFTVADDP